MVFPLLMFPSLLQKSTGFGVRKEDVQKTIKGVSIRWCVKRRGIFVRNVQLLKEPKPRRSGIQTLVLKSGDQEEETSVALKLRMMRPAAHGKRPTRTRLYNLPSPVAIASPRASKQYVHVRPHFQVRRLTTRSVKDGMGG